MAGTPQPSNSWWRRLGWLILIWAGSVATLALLAWCIRILMHAAGLVGR
jgi:hypothetical protein